MKQFKSKNEGDKLWMTSEQQQQQASSPLCGVGYMDQPSPPCSIKTHILIMDDLTKCIL